MATTFADVLRAITTWEIAEFVQATDSKGKAALAVDGEIKRYPYWLAVMKINQIGVERGS